MDTYLLIGILHILVIVPFLLWVGLSRAATPEWAYNVLFGLGLYICVYHGYMFITRFLAQSPAIWIHLFHVILVGPLLITIGYYEKRTERPAYELLLIAAFGALGYHLYKLVMVSQSLGQPRSSA